jgi:23S rRNA pseudouridine1911/1915/1917 synthase
VSEPFEVLYADNHVLAVRKPAGLPTAPDASGDPSLLELARAWVAREYQKPGPAFLGLVHRLDRPVSGVVVFGRTSKGAARLAASFRERNARKVYLALVEGLPADHAGTLEQWLVKDRAANRVRAAAPGAPGALLARTAWRVVGERGGHSLLELEPATGRPHQLRAACAELGCPIRGDLKYGARAPLPDASIALHAWRLDIDHPTRPERLTLEARLPDLDVWHA